MNLGRRTLGLLLVLVLLISLTSPTLAAGEKVTLKLWTGWQPDHYVYKTYEAGLARFMEEHPNIEVIHETVAWGDINSKAIASTAAGDVPNAVWGWDPVSIVSAATDLTEWIENDASFDKSSVLDVAWDFVTINGGIKAVPAALEPQVLLYNNKVLEETGIEVPKTLDELVENISKTRAVDAAGNLTKLGYWPGIEAYVWNSQPQNYYKWPLLRGCDWFDEQTGRFTINTPETVETIEWIRSIAAEVGYDKVQRYIASNEATLSNIDGGTGPYYTGDVTYWINAPWMLRMNQFDSNMDIRVATPPMAENGASLVSGCIWWTPKGVEHPEETWELLKFLISEDWQYELFLADPNPPTNAATMATVAKDPKYAWIQTLLDQGYFEKAAVAPRTAAYNVVGQTLMDNLEDLYLSDKPIADILQMAEDAGNEELSMQ